MPEQSASVKVGNRIRFMLYMGREVDGVVRAILQTASGVRYRMEYGNGPYLATISPEQIVQPEKPDAPKDVEL
jgi:hypothetical protein